MAKLPEIKTDPTIRKVYENIIRKKQLEKKRNYLGASEIGHQCWRRLFYSFRAADIKEITEENFNAEVKRITSAEDGYTQEERIIKELNEIDGVTVYCTDGTKDEEGNENQIGFEMLLGHFRGHVDGVITGLLQSPKTPHVFEVKCKDEKFINNLKKIKEQVGEKKSLTEWDETYYAQAQIYMRALNLTRHYMVIMKPGGRGDIETIRTEYSSNYAEDLIMKAKSIIFDNWDAPARMSEKREFYLCKWCEFQGICHDGKFPLVNCKTCRYSEPVNGGIRFCHKLQKNLDNNMLHVGDCKYHIYNPALVSAKLIEQQEDCCIYETDKKIRFSNCVSAGMPELKDNIAHIFTSNDLREKIVFVNNLEQKDLLKIQKEFDGEFSNKKAWDMI